MKKSLVFVLAAVLVAGLIGGPALAGKKKKKKAPEPVTETITYTESGTMTGPAPSSLAIGGVTESEFTVVNDCASLPSSQGLDGHVVLLPEEYKDGNATLEVVGTDATGQHDMDVYFYDSACGLMEPYMTEGSDPSGAIPAGAAAAVVDLLVGANASFELTATNTITVTP